MLIKKLEVLNKSDGSEGTVISQIFHPHNTLNGIRYSVAHSTISPGQKSKPHKMKTSEVYFVLQGEGIMHIEDETEKVSKNDAIYVPPFSKQFLENSGKSDLMVLCIVDPAWKKEDEEILE